MLYCKFWELDADHDFLITKEEFSRYSGHALSKKAVDRIFDEIPRKFKSKIPNKMSYDDFICNYLLRLSCLIYPQGLLYQKKIKHQIEVLNIGSKFLILIIMILSRKTLIFEPPH